MMSVRRNRQGHLKAKEVGFGEPALTVLVLRRSLGDCDCVLRSRCSAHNFNPLAYSPEALF
jgi:hypothetical protein